MTVVMNFSIFSTKIRHSPPERKSTTKYRHRGPIISDLFTEIHVSQCRSTGTDRNLPLRDMEKSLRYQISHKRRKFASCSLESPFPVPIESLNFSPASAKTWCFYTGIFSHNNVLVHHSGDMEFLSKLVSNFC